MSLAVGIVLGREAVVDELVAPLVKDDAGRAQDAEVPGSVRLRQIERLLEVTHAQLAMGQERHDPQAHVIAQRLEKT